MIFFFFQQKAGWKIKSVTVFLFRSIYWIKNALPTGAKRPQITSMLFKTMFSMLLCWNEMVPAWEIFLGIQISALLLITVVFFRKNLIKAKFWAKIFKTIIPSATKLLLLKPRSLKKEVRKRFLFNSSKCSHSTAVLLRSKKGIAAKRS